MAGDWGCRHARPLGLLSVLRRIPLGMGSGPGGPRAIGPATNLLWVPSIAPAEHTLPLQGHVFHSFPLRHGGVKSFIPRANHPGGGRARSPAWGHHAVSPSTRHWGLPPFPRLLEVLCGSCPRPPHRNGGLSLFSQMPPPLSVWLLSWNESHFSVLTLSSLPPSKTQAMTRDLNHALSERSGT